MYERTNPADDTDTDTDTDTGVYADADTGQAGRAGRAGPDASGSATGPDTDTGPDFAGCVLALAAGATGFFTWLHGAGPGVSGAFEGERDLSLLYLELPLLLFGFPVVALAAWGATRAVLRRTGGTGKRAVRNAVPVLAATVTLALLTWAALLWLDSRVAPFVHPHW